jgi:hypothetical protein
MSIKAFIHWSISVVVGGKLQGINSSFIQHYVIKFVSDLQQVGGFQPVLQR